MPRPTCIIKINTSRYFFSWHVYGALFFKVDHWQHSLQNLLVGAGAYEMDDAFLILSQSEDNIQNVR